MKRVLLLVFFGLVTNSNLIKCLDVDEAVTKFLAKHTGNTTEVDLETWEPPLEMKKNLVYYLSGFDDEDRPVWVAEWGKWDVKQYVEKGGEILKAFDHYVNQQMVKMLHSLKLRSTEEYPVTQLVFIIDLEGFPIEQLSSAETVLHHLANFAKWTDIAEVIEKGYVLNTNFIGEKMVNLVKPIFGNVYSRFEIYGTNKDVWIPKVLKNIPRSQLPEWYGGVKDFKPLKIYGR